MIISIIVKKKIELRLVDIDIDVKSILKFQPPCHLVS